MTDPLAARLHNLARTINAIPHLERHADCGCPTCRAQTWDHTGYPSSTFGDGIRSADRTSSTERGALTLTPPLTYATRLAAARLTLEAASVTYYNLLAELGYDPTNPQQKATADDRVAVGRGNCNRCERFCIGDGTNDRLRSGMCHACHMGYNRWRRTNPAGNTADYIRTNPVRLRVV